MKYKNPIICGFNPDPSICRVDEDYYLVTSTFEFFPGIPVYHSRDLVNWTQIGNCIECADWLPYEKVGPSGGMWAPTIRYYKGKFYVTATFQGFGNFVISTDNPASGWSKPVKVDMGGIDPSLFFENGKAYYCTNERGADPKEAISLAEIDVETGKLCSEIRQIWNGIGGGFLEAPHVYHIGEWYYLLTAEGGTGLNHMITVARSREIWGPYESYHDNPILTNRNDTTKQIACAGHGDLVEDMNGNWWMVHLGTRPANNFLSHVGRETFLMPVTWENEWPVVGHDKKCHLEQEAPLWKGQQLVKNWEADFSCRELQWLFVRNPHADNYRMEEGEVFLMPSQTKLSDATGSPTFMAVRPIDLECETVAEIDFAPERDGDEVGMAVYLSNEFFYNICKRRENGTNYILVEKRAYDFEQRIFKQEVGEGKVSFKIRAEREKYHFYYAREEQEYMTAGSVATRFLSCEIAGKCFTGVLTGVYAQCEEDTTAVAKIMRFRQSIL